MSHDAYDACTPYRRYARNAYNRVKRHKRHGFDLEAVAGQPASPIGAALDLVCSFENGASE